MVEVVDLLKANDFRIYIVTATERNIVQALVQDKLGILPVGIRITHKRIYIVEYIRSKGYIIHRTQRDPFRTRTAGA